MAKMTTSPYKTLDPVYGDVAKFYFQHNFGRKKCLKLEKLVEGKHTVKEVVCNSKGKAKNKVQGGKARKGGEAMYGTQKGQIRPMQ